jgi:PAS domain S-box-containing protein
MVVKTTQFEILLAVPDALVGVGQEGVIRPVNPQTKLLFGYNRDHLIGQPMKTLAWDSGGA